MALLQKNNVCPDPVWKPVIVAGTFSVTGWQTGLDKRGSGKMHINPPCNFWNSLNRGIPNRGFQNAVWRTVARLKS
jgi:hypothetical protein